MWILIFIIAFSLSHVPCSILTVVPGGGVTPGGRSGLKKQDIIAIVIGVGGFLLILIVVCTLILLKRTKKRGVGECYLDCSCAFVEIEYYLVRILLFLLVWYERNLLVLAFFNCSNSGFLSVAIDYFISHDLKARDFHFRWSLWDEQFW